MVYEELFTCPVQISWLRLPVVCRVDFERYQLQTGCGTIVSVEIFFVDRLRSFNNPLETNLNFSRALIE